jgi:uncharacterized protein (DUF1800 family)
MDQRTQMPTSSRAVLLGGALAAAVAGCASARPDQRDGAARAATVVDFPAPSAEPRELAADQQIIQALNRLTFGARPGDVAHVRAIGLDRWIADQLQPDRIDDRAAAATMARYETLGRSPAELMRDYPPPALLRARQRRREGMAPGAAGDSPTISAADSAELRRVGQRSRRVTQEIASAKLARAVVSERQLQEVMVDFWENHFNVYAAKGPVERYYLSDFDERVIRPHALGKFRDLLGAVAKSPAMLYYLDNWESTADSGRPVLRPGAGRRESEVGLRPGRRAVSRRVPTPDSRVPGSRRRGLNENYGRELLELHTLGVDGGYTQQDVIDVARALTGWTVDRPRQGGGFVFRPAMHDAGEKIFLGHRLAPNRGIEDGEQVLDIVATHPATARFIATKLVRRFVSDSVPPALVDRVAATFTRSDGDIRECLRTIFTSPEFFSRSAYKAKVKSPFELVVSALRAVGAQPDSTPRTAQLIAKLGEPLYGHLAPNGYPERGDAWINTGAILARINFGLLVASGRVPGASPAEWTDGKALASLPHDAQVDGVIRTILGGEASPDTRKVLESGVNPMASDSTAGATRRGGLETMVGLALGAPEFQRR